mmetsp:Transcript_15792/g.21712  ORF Transcript_15792/g.21712 Transcript_15792/m.21712 type:complete len:141 (+) Transcript_15792:265-687(+)
MRNGGGNVVFQRDWFIQETSNVVLKKVSSGYRSYYWRAPVGSGKSVFLKLLGSELQNRGCRVYLIIANKLDLYSDAYFTKVAKDAGDKTVVLLIDEVQNNMNSFHWDALLLVSASLSWMVLHPNLTASIQIVPTIFSLFS